LNKENTRIFGLDILRTIAVLLVLIAHTIPFIGKSDLVNTISLFSAINGVEIFFVISGFLIGTILIKIHNQDLITSIHSVKIFWVRRWFRTLPNYYLMLIGYALLYYVGTKQIIFDDLFGLSFLIFLQNFTSEMTNKFYGVSWSLAVEEWFYLLFPLFLYVFQFLFKKKTTSFFVVIVTFVLVPLLIKMTLAVNNYDVAWDAGYRKIVPLRLDAIGIGVLMAFIKYYNPSFWNNKKTLLFSFGLITFALLMVVFYYLFVINYDFPNERQLSSPGFFMNTLFFTFMSFSLAAMLPFIHGIEVRNSKNYVYRSINIISLTSYSIYLSHPFYIVLVQVFFKQKSSIIQFIAIWVITIIGSYFQYRFFEVKFTALRDKFGVKKDVITV
jgi:peptidoglycan/LPS O-acetylase OafA/YrhL